MLFQAPQVPHLKRGNWSCECVCLHVCVCVSVPGMGGWQRVATYVRVLEKEMHRAEQRPEGDPEAWRGWRCYQGPAALLLQAKPF